MANLKISEFAQASPLLTADEIVIQRGATPPNLRASIQQVLDLVPSIGSGSVNTLARWATADTLGDSIISEVGTTAIVERIMEAKTPRGGNAGFIVNHETKILNSEGFIVYDFLDANDNRHTYARLVGIIRDDTVGATSGAWQAEIMVAGVNTYLIQLDGSLATPVLLNGNSRVTGNLEVTGTMSIGIASGDGTLHVHSSSAGAVTADTSADELVLERAGTGGSSYLTPDDQFSRFYMGSPSDNAAARIMWKYDDLSMKIGTVTAGGTVELRSGVGVPAIDIDASQVITMSSLAGSGTRTVVADLNGVLSAP